MGPNHFQIPIYGHPTCSLLSGVHEALSAITYFHLILGVFPMGHTNQILLKVSLEHEL